MPNLHPELELLQITFTHARIFWFQQSLFKYTFI